MSWNTTNDLHRDLDSGFLDSPEKFHQVIETTIDALKEADSNQLREATFTLANQSVVTANWLPFFRSYLLDRDFRKILFRWYRDSHPEQLAPYKEISRLWVDKIKELSELEKPFDPLQKDKSVDQITDQVRQIEEIVQEALGLEPRLPSDATSYEKEVLELLNQQAETISGKVAELHEALQAKPEIKLENERDLLEKYANVWLEQHPELAQAENAQSLANQASQTALEEIVGNANQGKQKDVNDAWEKLAKEFTDQQSVHAKVAELEQSRELSGLAFGSGLLTIALRKDKENLSESGLDLNKPENTPLLWAFFQQIVVIIDTNYADNDVSSVVGAFTRAVDQLIEFLNNEKKERLEKAQKEIEAAFLPVPVGGADSDDSGGGIDEDEETDQPLPALPPELLARVVEAWQPAIALLRGLTADEQTQLNSFLEGWSLKIESFHSEQALEKTLAKRYPNEIALEENGVSDGQEFLDALRPLVESLAQKTDDAESDEFDSVVPTIDTTAGEDFVSSLSGEKLESAKNIGQVARAKFQLLEMVNEAITQELKALRDQHGFKYSDSDIESYVHQQQGQLSQDVWQKLLEHGALTERIDSTTLTRLWSHLTDDYLERIVVQIPALQSVFAMIDADGLNTSGPGKKFYLDWLKDQRNKERILSAQQEGKLDELTANLQPALVEEAFRQSQSLTISTAALKQHIQNARAEFYQNSGLPDDPELNAFLSKILQAAEAIQQTRDPEVAARAFDVLFEELDFSLIGAAQRDPNLQANAYASLWKSIFITDPILYAYFFALPEFAVAGEYLRDIRARWVQVLNSDPGSLSSKALKVANYWQGTVADQKAAGTPEEKGYLQYDAKLPEQRQIDLEFALNLLYLSELDRSQQSNVETAIYSYFVLNQRKGIQLQQVMIMISNAEAAFQQAELIAQLNNQEISAEDAEANYRAALAQLQSDKTYGEAFRSDGYHARNIAEQQRAQAANTNAQKMKALMGAVKVAGLAASGNWVGAAKGILTNKELQKQAKQLIQKIMIAQLIAQLIPILVLLAFLKMLWDFVMLLWDIVTFVPKLAWNLGKAIGEATWNAGKGLLEGGWNLGKGLANGVVDLGKGAVSLGKEVLGTGEASEAAANTAIAARNEVTAAAQNAAQGAQAATYNTAMSISTAAAQAGVASALLKVSGFALFTALMLPTILTIIVITVIGGAMNDLPAGYGLPDSFLNQLGLLNTTDMGCIAIDQSSFSTIRAQSYIPKAQETVVQVMRHPGARALCNLTDQILIVYDPSVQWGMHVSGNFHLGDAWFDFPDFVRPFTIFHEFGHFAQYKGDFAAFFDQEFGANNWPTIETYGRTGFANTARESQAEAMGLTMYADLSPDDPCPYIGCTYDIRTINHNGKNVYEVVHRYFQSLE